LQTFEINSVWFLFAFTANYDDRKIKIWHWRDLNFDWEFTQELDLYSWGLVQAANPFSESSISI